MFMIASLNFLCCEFILGRVYLQCVEEDVEVSIFGREKREGLIKESLSTWLLV